MKENQVMEITFKNKNKLITLSYDVTGSNLILPDGKVSGIDLYKLLWNDPCRRKETLSDSFLNWLTDKDFLGNRWRNFYSGFPDIKLGQELNLIKEFLQKAKENNIEVFISNKSKAVLDLADFLSNIDNKTYILYDKENPKINLPIRAFKKNTFLGKNITEIECAGETWINNCLKLAIVVVEYRLHSGNWDIIPINEEIVELYSEIKHES